MLFDEVLAGLIHRAIETCRVTTHERVVLTRYTPLQARAIIERLLTNGDRATVSFYRDNDSAVVDTVATVVLRTPYASIELVPYVVATDRQPHDPSWYGTQAYAGKLRSCFSHGAPPGVIRILLIFDQHPVETEHTTALAVLADAMESLSALHEWVTSVEWAPLLPEDLRKGIAGIIAAWKRAREKSELPLMRTHLEELESLATFADRCRTAGSIADVGRHLPSLGLLFADPELVTEQSRRLEQRIQDNYVLAHQLEAIRAQRVFDPLTDADRLLNMGVAGEDFHDSMVRALTSPNDAISKAMVTYEEVASRRRTSEKTPAWLDITGMSVTELDGEGKPIGKELPWRLLQEPRLPPDGGDPAEVSLATTAGKVRLSVPVRGAIPSVLFLDGQHHPLPDFPDERLTPHTQLILDVDVSDEMAIRTLAVRTKTPGRGRVARPYQEVQIAIVPGPVVPIPEGARLDVAEQAFVVDNTAHEIPIQFGAQVVTVSGESLPPADGTSGLLRIGDTTIRWRGEDRGARADPQPGSRQVALRELLGILQTGNPLATQAYFTERNELVTVCQTAATVNVSEEELAAEAALIREPQRFAGTLAMSDTALTELRQVVPELFDKWLSARQAFFTLVAAASEMTLPGAGRDRPSMYLVDLRDAELARSAEDYVETYCELLTEICKRAAGAANTALIEPVLLCDRAIQQDDAVSIAPTHPLAVSLLAALQRGFFTREWPNIADRDACVALFNQPLLAGTLPWLPWRGGVLNASRATPLLWRRYGIDGGAVDTSDDLGPVIVDKVRNLVNLAPHLRQSDQRVFINIEIGKGSGEYLSRALRELINDASLPCGFDIGVVRAPSAPRPNLLDSFSGGSRTARRGDADHFRRAVRVADIANVASREAHLVFRMEAADSEKNPFTTLTSGGPLIRSTGFAAGLLEEPARFATLCESEVIYTRYVHSLSDPSTALRCPDNDGIWDGPWRRRFSRVLAISRNAVIGLRNAISPNLIACERLRQNADTTTSADYDKSFVTVHCDPTQGPEFFVGSRASRSKVFLVECSDRGSPQLPGRDIVTVTSRIAPFRAALTAAIRQLPAPLRAVVDDDVAKGLLRDINLLRGTEVFTFLRQSSRASGHVNILAGLDNILALRLLLDRRLAVQGYFPIVVSLGDLASRSRFFSPLRKGLQCDDVMVIYLPLPAAGSARLLYRITEVKFGQRRELKRKAVQQLAETARKVADVLPPGIWRNEEAVAPLLMEKDVAWVLHEAIERYRSFGLIPHDEAFEERWGLRELFRKLHSGDFSLLPYASPDGRVVNGTALLCDPDIPGHALDTDIDGSTEILTVPLELIKHLLITDARASATGVTDTSEPITADSLGAAVPAVARPHAATQASVAPYPERCIPESASSHEQEPLPGRQEASDDVSLSDHGSDTPECCEAPDTVTRPRISEDVAAAEDRVNSFFEGFVGNEGPVSKLKRSLAIALWEGRTTIEPVALFGPKSTGKTELARRVARALNVPRIELSETTFRSADDLASKIIEAAAIAGDRMPPSRTSSGQLVRRAPPMIVFVDEVHQLKARAKESLLTATEPDDHKLLSTHGTIDTINVTFIIATTDPGELNDPLKSRVDRLDLREYGIDELVAILRAHQYQNDDFPPGADQFDDECLRVIARAGRLVPRQALRLFRDAARYATVGYLTPSVGELQRHYWEQDGIDKQGLNNRDRDYLRLLFPDHVLGVEALCAHLGERNTTVTQDVEPYLLRLKLIERARAGRKLTAGGREVVATYIGR